MILLLYRQQGNSHGGHYVQSKRRVQTDNERFADLSGPDFYRTPRWATFALIDNEKFSGEIWESACGDGTMSRSG